MADPERRIINTHAEEPTRRVIDVPGDANNPQIRRLLDQAAAPGSEQLLPNADVIRKALETGSFELVSEPSPFPPPQKP